jgi:hypothetical protein
VSLHASKHGFGEHDIVSSGARDVAELEYDAAHRVDGDVEHVPAVDVEPGAKLSQPGVYRLCPFDLEPCDLYLKAQIMLVLVRTVNHEHIPPAVVGDQKQRKPQASKRRARPVGQVHERRRRQTQRQMPISADELVKRHASVVRRKHQALNYHLTARLP